MIVVYAETRIVVMSVRVTYVLGIEHSGLIFFLFDLGIENSGSKRPSVWAILSVYFKFLSGKL